MYKIVNSLEKKEIGIFPQTTSGGRLGNLFKDHEGLHGPLNVKHPISPISVFHRKAKKTDYIGIASTGRKMIISPYFYTFLKVFLPKHQVWDMQFSNDVYKMDWKKMAYVVKEGAQQEFYDYKILHINYPKDGFINFQNSDFFLDTRGNYLQNSGIKGISINYMQSLNEAVEIISSNHYRELNQELKKKGGARKIIVPKKLVFNINKDEIFRMVTPINNLSGYYVSEDLKNNIQAQGFTGMNFKPLEAINPHIDIECI